MKIQSIAVLAIYLCSAYGDEAQRERKGDDLLRELKKMSIKKAKKLERQKMTHGAKSQKLEMEEVAETGTVPGIIEMEEIERFEDKAEGTVPGIIEMEEIESFEDEAKGDARGDVLEELEELEEVVEELTEELVAVETEIVDMNHKGVKSRTAAKTHKPTATKTDTPTREPATATPMADNPKSGKTHKPRSRTAAKTHKPTATMTATPTRKPVTAKPTGRR